MSDDSAADHRTTEDHRTAEDRRTTEDRQEAADHQEVADYRTRVSPFVERFAADLTEAGMQRMASRVFACLLASEEGALTSAELGDRLQASPAAISGAVRYLSQVALVSRQRDPGSRRERYMLHQDVWYTSLLSRDHVLGRWLVTLNTGADDLGADTPGGRRVRESAEFLEFMRTGLEDLLNRWHARQQSPMTGTE
ncbi:GbsR/MarR family transcriptional regulator [Streptomyces qinglanensis]|uniref:DNA-binding transcriptional regulator GbsR, MarR family n=1 Tax=Streptomyces qinglanensis TaxID=943816 RepID=A0A1H9PR16_9ACTN|nr:MarR family transcriptional regulator [Streptomyces qinglanensis]SER49993.1 DNA-binding transcriptional regulator GbsR, MarR family [Streptomyces qinglanensis]